jgi:hypothetical protein
MDSYITMSQPELDRYALISKLIEKRITQGEVAVILSITVRQVRRLMKAVIKQGAHGLVSKHRGKTSNNKLPVELKERAISLIKEKYVDFRPTFAAEKLAELHGITVSTETIRKWMIDAGLWKTRDQRLKRAFQPRYRRDCYGELIQIDGSHHHWFEERAPKCALLVYVDDATSQLMELHFTQSESTFSYFKATQEYLEKHGKPVAFYSDKHSTFNTNKRGELGGDGVTQFGRALSDLNIDIICANTCQAKGRVERANLTLQDRLVKELRLHSISTVEAANAYAAEFVADYNQRFGKVPRSAHNVHRPVRENEDLDDIFSCQEPRTLSNNLTLQYDRVIYLIDDNPETRKLKRKSVSVHDYYDGSIKIFYDKMELRYRIFDRLQKIDQAAIVDNKRLGAVLQFIQQKQTENEYGRSASTPSRSHIGKESASEKKNPTKKYRRKIT